MPATCRPFSKHLLAKFYLGVCLGEQAIGEAYGAKIVHAPKLMHGKPSSWRQAIQPCLNPAPISLKQPDIIH